MPKLRKPASQFRSLSFDCYGTLIDWETGIRNALATLAASPEGLSIDQREFFDTYQKVEAAIEAGPYKPYRAVLNTVQAELLRRFSLDAPADRAGVLADSFPGWKPFDDTCATLARLKGHYRLGVVSNVEHALFAQTARHFESAIGQFDFVITGEDVGTYKPSHPHFLHLLDMLGDAAGTHLHVAQSLFHDGVPAKALGIPFVWINRRDETNHTTAAPIAEFNNLAGLADWLGV